MFVSISCAEFFFYHFFHLCGMASKCGTCNEEILTAEFIKCHGLCANAYHPKCVAVTKSLLNAISSNPNVRWYCHSCHSGDMSLTSSIGDIKSSIGQLSSTLTSDLSKFLGSMNEMTKCITDTIKSLSSSSSNSNTPHSSVKSTTDRPANGFQTLNPSLNSSKRRRENHLPSNPVKFRRIASAANHRPASFTTTTDSTDNDKLDRDRTSLVISNIAPDIGADDIKDFVASKLKADREIIRVTTLMPRSLKQDDIKFMQFRMSLPNNLVNTVTCDSFWPKGVRLRNFIYKKADHTSSKSRSPPVNRNCFGLVSPPPECNETAKVDEATDQDFQQPPTNATVVLQETMTNSME